MNTQFKNREQNLGRSFDIDRASLTENRANSDMEWKKVAPNKVIVAVSDSTWLLEDNNQFHFTEFN